MARERREPPPPVDRVIAVRTLQVGAAGLFVLAGMRALLPPRHFRKFLLWEGALTAAGLSAYFGATFTAGVPFGAPVQTRLPAAAGNAVALTFDDGPHPEITPRILDLLAEHGAKATFFVLGDRVSRYPDLVRRLRNEGHGIGIHGLHHRTMVLQSAQAVERDLRETLRRIEAAAPTPPGGTAIHLFRPPYGFKTPTVSRVATRLGLCLIAWSVNSRDYAALSAEAVQSRVTARLRPGAIVLLHEHSHTDRTTAALTPLLRHCAERGWRCIALD